MRSKGMRREKKIPERDKRGNRKDPSLSVKGVVTARICNYCRHHEIGIKTRKGYYPLRPGMKIEVIEG
jgi:exosome complex RNA-binding protein Rrp4